MQREKITLGWAGKSAPVADIAYIEVVELASTGLLEDVGEATRVDPWTDPEPLELCLELWKLWMEGDDDRDLGYKTMRGMCADGGGQGKDLYEAQQANDMRIAKATDAMIESMGRLHIWAIHRSTGIATAWNFPNAAYPQVLVAAKSELSDKLRKNMCTKLLFI
ncbi:hypothetical protein [Janthinobacterium sp. HH104]|uniref:hypothetical protein n=1 Tax=Janthinobacterium sp. HH104 TaxID=1537276 RepID=UPI0011131D0D|nr:hypothetical protein [Janthinobacterium sp. HH104]